MASIARDKDGRRRILFVDGDRRPTIRLGKVSQRFAEGVKLRVEHLLVAKLTGHPIDGDTAAWVAGLEPWLADKLANVGLIAKRASQEAVELGAFLRAYVDSRADLKPSTKLVRNIVIADLNERFGENRDVTTIGAGDADDFKQWLIGRKLASTTIHKRLQVARSFFHAMRRRKLIAENPFEGVKSTAVGIRDRQRFVTREETEQLLAACPNTNWRTIVALARFGGLRCPSEVLSLKLSDVNWETGRIVVTAPKTEHLGKATRTIPLFPELRTILLEAAEAAEPGAVYVVDERMRSANRTATGWGTVNLRTTFAKIVRRAGLPAWPRMFHNLRASRETELVEKYPVQVVTDWLGNSPKVAMRHYLMTTESHFEAAVNDGANAAQNPAQQAHERAGIGRKPLIGVEEKTADLPRIAEPCGYLHGIPVAGTGLEPSAFSSGNKPFATKGGAESGALGAPNAPTDHDLAHVIAAWPSLPEATRAAVMRLIDEAAKGRPT